MGAPLSSEIDGVSRLFRLFCCSSPTCEEWMSVWIRHRRIREVKRQQLLLGHIQFIALMVKKAPRFWDETNPNPLHT